jgi:hypothetical protein
VVLAQQAVGEPSCGCYEFVQARAVQVLIEDERVEQDRLAAPYLTGVEIADVRIRHGGQENPLRYPGIQRSPDFFRP